MTGPPTSLAARRHFSFEISSSSPWAAHHHQQVTQFSDIMNPFSKEQAVEWAFGSA
jgi:hypothetical protein